MISERKMGDKTLFRTNPPVLELRPVLLSHIKAILCSSSGQYKLESYIQQELESQSDEELMKMLHDHEKLYAFVQNAEQKRMFVPEETEDKEYLGNQLFEKVTKIETELCAQITGMLLELDPSAIHKLLSDAALLQTAVMKAKEEFLREKYPDSLPLREKIGEAVYDKAYELYPQNAAKITGMLLELPFTCLHRFLYDTDEMASKIEEARRTLEEVNKWIKE